jgi:PAS domain-containing protein
MRIVRSQGWNLVREDGTQEPLDALPRPALVTDASGCVVTVNSAFVAAYGREAAELEGLRFGEALTCKRSHLPEGCGRAAHCRDCTVRRMVTEVGRTRLARWRVPTVLETAKGRFEVCVTFRPADGDLVLVEVDEVPCEAAG